MSLANSKWIINQFLMDCGDQPIIDTYLECLPEEILQVIYKMVYSDNVSYIDTHWVGDHYLDLNYNGSLEKSYLEKYNETVSIDRFRIKQIVYRALDTGMTFKYPRGLLDTLHREAMDLIRTENPALAFTEYCGVKFRLRGVATRYETNSYDIYKKKQFKIIFVYRNNDFILNKTITSHADYALKKNSGRRKANVDCRFYTIFPESWKSIRKLEFN